MKFLSPIIYFTGAILEIVICILTYVYETLNLGSFLFIHLFIILGIYFINKMLIKDEKKLPLYLGLFFPVIGLILLSILDLLLFLNKSKNNMIEDYEKYIEYVDQIIVKHQVDFEKEINMTSALDILKYSSNEKKKDVIVDLIAEDIDLKVKILKTALRDEDPEVVHYASSTLNLLESEYEHEINFLRDSYNKKRDEETLKKLIKVYDKYLNSGLLSIQLKNILLQQYLDILMEFKDKFGEEYNLLLDIADVYMNLDKTEESIKILKTLYENYTQEFEHYIYSMKAFYLMDNYKEVSNIAKKIIDLDLNIPDRYKPIVDYWK
ncbi:hypothetical protein [Tepidibacter hydrothermalis]|uniref:Uncharacterized protein n=1 Tax=Tepidibacter hydrothermalis TaxID=3036126 RepID=A0ABY8EDV0_9FIRM|nr:hypothetical protein [Tepidibacter hydrothermalis]WFD11124.1 hypothetical protein P4S50_03345 [Tepidibacter hydrothermalis]